MVILACSLHIDISLVENLPYVGLKKASSENIVRGLGCILYRPFGIMSLSDDVLKLAGYCL